MKKSVVLFLLIIIATGLSFARNSRRLTYRRNSRRMSKPARLVAMLYNIYKKQKYRQGLKITTGTMYKRFKKLYDHLRMNQYKVPQKLKRLSNMMSGYRFAGQYNLTYKNRKYATVDCIWIMKYRDTTNQTNGITITKLVIRAYLLKKVNGRWKISSEKFVTEHILRDAEWKLVKAIEKAIKRQRAIRRRRMGNRNRYRRRGYRHYRRRYGRAG